jgi:hypothetical protein
MVKEVNEKSDFDAIIKDPKNKGKLVFVDFFATCKRPLLCVTHLTCQLHTQPVTFSLLLCVPRVWTMQNDCPLLGNGGEGEGACSFSEG